MKYHLEVFECTPIRRRNRWKTFLIKLFCFGFLIGACSAVAFWKLIF